MNHPETWLPIAFAVDRLTLRLETGLQEARTALIEAAAKGKQRCQGVLRPDAEIAAPLELSVTVMDARLWADGAPQFLAKDGCIQFSGGGREVILTLEAPSGGEIELRPLGKRLVYDAVAIAETDFERNWPTETTAPAGAKGGRTPWPHWVVLKDFAMAHLDHEGDQGAEALIEYMMVTAQAFPGASGNRSTYQPYAAEVRKRDAERRAWLARVESRREAIAPQRPQPKPARARN